MSVREHPQERIVKLAPVVYIGCAELTDFETELVCGTLFYNILNSSMWYFIYIYSSSSIKYVIFYNFSLSSEAQWKSI